MLFYFYINENIVKNVFWIDQYNFSYIKQNFQLKEKEHI